MSSFGQQLRTVEESVQEWGHLRPGAFRPKQAEKDVHPRRTPCFLLSFSFSQRTGKVTMSVEIMVLKLLFSGSMGPQEAPILWGMTLLGTHNISNGVRNPCDR